MILGCLYWPYFSKMAYDCLYVFKELDNRRWIISIWKWCIPMKIKLFSWILLDNSILTWDNYIKRGGCGPNICSMCKEDEEAIDHLMIKCSFTRKV